jgi:pimeloyl-ACP methyl ester carboxylesterase
MDEVREYGAAAVSGVVLVGAMGGLDPEPARAAGPTPLPPAYAEAKALQRSPLIEDQMRAAAVIGGLLTERPVQDGLDAVSLQLGAMVPPYVRAGLMLHPGKNQDLVATLTVPVLIARGDRDPSVPADASAALAKALPSATVVNFPGSGHSPFREDPQAFDAALARFVESTRNGPASPRPADGLSAGPAGCASTPQAGAERCPR